MPIEVLTIIAKTISLLMYGFIVGMSGVAVYYYITYYRVIRTGVLRQRMPSYVILYAAGINLLFILAYLYLFITATILHKMDVTLYGTLIIRPLVALNASAHAGGARAMYLSAKKKIEGG